MLIYIREGGRIGEGGQGREDRGGGWGVESKNGKREKKREKYYDNKNEYEDKE